ncbi:hypothetical protein GGS26DRAFT_113123 [Hypomontagnella submonticulosa]|nr:hypothetical protein GGS26DRAFT_113123 [Hypomontagnella submonticulosa]
MDSSSEDSMPESAQADRGTPWVRPPRPEDEKAQRAAQDTTLDEPAKIDAIAEIRRWFCGNNENINAYLAGNMDVATAVDNVAKPIEAAYSSADYGRGVYRAEMSARQQRKYLSPEVALERWGAEEDVPEPDPATADLPSTENQLWDLWYSVLHAAKRIPWQTGAAQQEKLLTLVQTLKARPNPPLPARFDLLKGKDWVLGSDTVWSSLLMLGPSGRETWNDGCGCGAGWLVPEQHAWTNVNAFVARLTASGTDDFGLYGVWALRDALEEHLEEKGHHRPAPILMQRHLLLTIASVWVKIAGAYMFAQRAKHGEQLPEDAPVDLKKRGRQLPWNKMNNNDAMMLCTARWEFWAARFEQEALDQELSEEVRECARESAEIIRGLLAAA